MDGKKLIKIARKAIESVFSKEDFKVEDFKKRCGIFVTLYKDEELRGCVGFIKSLDLNKGIVDGARAAAFSDPRFRPVEKGELKKIRIEVSLLSEPELLEGDYLKQIKIGRDGLIVERNARNGLLLPQVFVEYKADVKQALEMTCEKAMLEKDSWRENDTKVYRFKCEVYSEIEPNGDVEKIM